MSIQFYQATLKGLFSEGYLALNFIFGQIFLLHVGRVRAVFFPVAKLVGESVRRREYVDAGASESVCELCQEY